MSFGMPVLAARRRGGDGYDPIGTPDSTVLLQLDFSNAANGTTSFADQSSYARAITTQGDAKAQSGKLELDGTGDWLEFADAAELAFGAGDWTIEVFGVEFDVLNAVNAMVAQWDSTLGRQLQVHYKGGWGYSLRAGGASTDLTGPTATVSTVYDLAFVRNGSSFLIYVGGAQVYSGTYSSTLNDPSSVWMVGASGDGSAVDGRIRAVRMSDFARYTGESYAVPAVPFAKPVVSSQSTMTSDTGFFGTGDTITGVPATFNEETTKTYAWLLDGEEISGETGLTYTVDGADLGGALQFVTYGTNANGTTTSTSDAETIATPTYSTESVTLSGGSSVTLSDTSNLEIYHRTA